MKLWPLLIFVPLLNSCSQGSPSTAPSVLYFTAIPDDNTTELRQKFEPLAAHLSHELGIPVRYLPTASYAASVEAFKNGDVQLAWFGGLTGAQARAAVPGSQAIAQGEIDPEYKSYFIAHQDSGLRPGEEFPENLQGKSFTFGSPSSTSGRLMPEYFIRTNTGKSPENFFEQPNHYSGSHDKTALLVQAGTFDSGALSYKTYEKMVRKGAIDPKVCFILWTTPTYPDYNWTVHPSVQNTFGEDFTEKLQGTLVSITDKELLQAVLRPEGLIPATNQDFLLVHQLAQELGFLR
jgi:phosphonate transport system substrate-binding protein